MFDRHLFHGRPGRVQVQGVAKGEAGAGTCLRLILLTLTDAEEVVAQTVPGQAGSATLDTDDLIVRCPTSAASLQPGMSVVNGNRGRWCKGIIRLG